MAVPVLACRFPSFPCLSAQTRLVRALIIIVVIIISRCRQHVRTERPEHDWELESYHWWPTAATMMALGPEEGPCLLQGPPGLRLSP